MRAQSHVILCNLCGPLVDKKMARAASMALAIYLWKGHPTLTSNLFGWADKIHNYIDTGQWPQEALREIGKENGNQEGRISRVWVEVQDPKGEEE